MSSSDHRFGRRSLFSGAILLGLASMAFATEGPPVEITMPAGTMPAVSGMEYEGVFEIHVFEPGSLGDIHIKGPGWTVLSVDLPAGLHRAAVGTIRIPFRAIPTDANQPIGLTLTFNGKRVFQRYEIGPAYFARANKGLRSVRLPNTTGWRAGAGGRGEPECGCLVSPVPLVRGVGRIVYTRPDGKVVGADRLRIELRDDDPVDFDLLWEGFTDQNGYFDTGCLDADVDGDGSGPDLVLYYETDNGWVDVTDNSIGEYTYWADTEEISNFAGDCYDFGWTTPAAGTMHTAIHISNVLTRARNYVEWLGGYTPDSVQVEWPVEAWTHYQSGPEEIHLNALHEWEEFVLIHEYGHHFMHHYGNPPNTDYCNQYCDDDPPDDCGHCVWCPENDHDAFNEGFPNWMADVITRSFSDFYEFEPGEPYEPILNEAFEMESPRYCENETYGDAIETEGFVGLLLRDIEDETQDDHDGDGVFDLMCLGARPAFQVLVHDHPTTILQFINSFRSRYPDETGDLWPTAYNVGGPAYVANFPGDTARPGIVPPWDSPTHPIGIGGADTCLTMEWDPAPDDVTGASAYSYYLHQDPTGIEPDEEADPIELTDHCKISARTVAWELGNWYFSIRARDNFGNWSDNYRTVGPFEITDCNDTGLLDICDIDCLHTGQPGGGICEFNLSPCIGLEGCGSSMDCNTNRRPDECDIAQGYSEDCNEDGVPDDCQNMKHWSGAIDNNWTNAGNWVEGVAPQTDDHVCISSEAPVQVAYQLSSTALSSLACHEDLKIHDGSNPFPPYSNIDFVGPSFVNGEFTLRDNSTLTVSDTLTLNGPFKWFGSILKGPGTTEVRAGLTLSTASVTMQPHDLVLSGGTVTSGGARITMSAGSLIDIREGVRYEYNGDSNIFDGLSSRIINSGTLVRASGDATATVLAPINNAGTVRVQTGELYLGGGGTQTGAFIGDPGTNLVLGAYFANSPHNLEPASTITVDSLELTANGSDIRGTIDITDTLAGTGGTWNFTDEANIISYGQHLIVDRGRINFYGPTDRPIDFQSVTVTTQGESAGAVDFSTGQLVNVENFNMVTGSLYGPSPMNISGSMTWTQGSFSGGGAMTANGPVTFNATSSNRNLARVLNITDQATILAGFGMTGAGRVNIFDEVIVNLQFDSGGIGAGTLSNNGGTIVRTTGTGQISVSANVLNGGVIHNQSGTLSLSGGGTHTGTVIGDPGSIFKLGGTTEFVSGSVLMAEDLHLFSGNGNMIRGDVHINGTLTCSGGTWTFADEANIINYGDHLNVNQATLHIDAPADEEISFDSITLGPGIGGSSLYLDTGQPVNTNTLTMSNGASLYGSSPIHVADQFTWNQGNIPAGGAITCNGTSTVHATSSARTLYRPLNNYGTMTIKGGFGTGASGPINNMPGALIDLQYENSRIGLTGVINNDGTIIKTTTAGNAGLPNVVNRGIIDIQKGGIDFHTTYSSLTQTAGETILNDTVINLFSDNRPMYLQGGVLKGNGSVLGDIDNSGGIVAPGFSVGEIQVDDYTQGAGATLDMEIAGTDPGEFDLLTVTGTATLAGELRVTDIDGFTPLGNDAFVILTAAQINGTFDTETIPSHYEVVYTATDVTVRSTLPSPDLNGDGVVDLLDFGLFQACFHGQGQPPSAECAAGVNADLDLDADVDLDDFARFYPALTANR